MIIIIGHVNMVISMITNDDYGEVIEIMVTIGTATVM